MARTCNGTDHIWLYEGDRCTENLAGTLAKPDAGTSIATSAKDELGDCIANDEARSMLITGPQPTGLLIEVWDSPDNSCSDDYSAIVLTEPINVNDTLCIEGIETTKRLFDGSGSYPVKTSHPGYDMF